MVDHDLAECERWIKNANLEEDVALLPFVLDHAIDNVIGHHSLLNFDGFAIAFDFILLGFTVLFPEEVELGWLHERHDL